MRKRNRIVFSALTAMCSLLLLDCTSFSSFAAAIPLANKGILDLSNCNIAKQGAINLDGEWEFFWDKLLDPSQMQSVKSEGYITQPCSWNDVRINGIKHSAYGVATFRLKVILNNSALDHSSHQLAFKLKQAHSASKVWINGIAQIENGRVSQNTDSFRAVIRPSECFFSSQRDTLEIVIQVANFFDNRLAGIDDRMTLSTQTYQIQAYHRKMFLFMSSFAVLFFIGIYHLLLWFVRKDQKVNLHFALLSIMMSLLSVWIGDKSIYYLIPNLPLELYYRIWYSFLALVPLFLLYLQDIFPKDLNKKIVQSCVIIYSVYLAMVFLGPKEIYIKATYFFLIVTLGYISYYLIVITKALKNRRRYSGWVMAGMSIGLIASVNDILFALGWITTGYYMPVGFLACVLSQSIVLSVEFTRSYRENVILRTQLQDSNTELEKRIWERTQELDIINEELKETIASKDKFFSILSHDLKNPFFAIKLIIEQLLRSYPNIEPAKMHRNLQLMNTTVNESSKILENLHVWSHLQTGKVQNNSEKLNVKAIVDNVIQLKELSAEQKDIYLTVDLEESKFVIADKNMFELIIRNLISNALKFTQRGGSISISSKTNDKYEAITVSDSGIGISDENMQKLFKIEGDFHTMGTEHESGTGLGLVLCSDFAKKMNGTITVTSKVGEGSSFTVSLPKS